MFKALTQRVHIEENQRQLGIKTRCSQHLGFAHLRDAGNRDLLEPEAYDPRQGMVGLTVLADEFVEMPTLPETEQGDASKEAEGQRGSEETRDAAFDRDAC